MTSLTDLEIQVSGGISLAAEKYFGFRGWLGSASSSSTSSVSSPQSSRSGTSSRSLPGLMRSGLVAYLPALLVGANAQIQLSLAQGTGEGERSDKTT